MKWNEIIITTTADAEEAVSEMLTTIGAAGVAIEDPNDIIIEVSKSDSLDYADPEFLDNLGTDVIIKAYFPETQSLGELVPLIGEKLKFISNFLDVGKGNISTNTIDEEDWANAWKKYYNTFSITENVTIKPSWQDVTISENKIVIELDPGMAFGTGTHETTKMCAVLIEKYIKDGDTVFDVGTGSGILAIMAAKLGASNVLAYDIDEVAVRVAKENSTINKANEVVTFSKGIIED
jgi:ribosomal protein L11 methyltransferase